jgi:hypothetical protein
VGNDAIALRAVSVSSDEYKAKHAVAYYFSVASLAMEVCCDSIPEDLRRSAKVNLLVTGSTCSSRWIAT